MSLAVAWIRDQKGVVPKTAAGNAGIAGMRCAGEAILATLGDGWLAAPAQPSP